MMKPRSLYYKTMASPVGSLRLIASDRGLCAVLFHGGRRTRLTVNGTLEQDDSHKMLQQAESQITEYFSGKRKKFELPLDVRGTVFQIKTWRELAKIPYARTISYGEQARRLGDANKARACGMANGRNPLPIVIPCHRVVGAGGGLTGFAGGIDIKLFLLKHEKENVE